MNRVASLGLVVGIALGFTVAPARAQAPFPAPAEPVRTFVNKSPFYLPINFEERFRPLLREVQLYVKDAAEIGRASCRERV